MMTEGQNLNFIQKKIDEKNSYERCDYAAVAGKQQFSIARAKLPSVIIAGGSGLKKTFGLSSQLQESKPNPETKSEKNCDK